MTRRLLVLIAFVLLIVAWAFAADDPFVGTWKLNIAKSKLGYELVFRSDIAKIEVIDNGLRISRDVVAQMEEFLTRETPRSSMEKTFLYPD